MNEQRTILSVWESGGNRINNFDVIRFVAAAGVVLSHSFEVTGGLGAFEPLMALTAGQASLGRVAVLTFFILSGFLIVKSWRADPNIGRYMIKRGLRIAPALWCVVFVSIFLLGPVFTTVSYLAYFVDIETGRYGANAILYTKYFSLPGVFENLPLAGVVNGPLWTLKFEVLCYALIACLGLARLLTPMICLVIIVAAYGVHGFGGGEEYGGLAYYVFASGDLMRAFFVGAAAAFFAGKIPLEGRLALCAALGLCIAGLLGLFDAAFPVLGGYLVFYLGLASTKRLSRFGKYGDFSYGIYVWGFPIQQIVMAITGVSWWFANFILAFPLTLVAAWASWRFVESPSLKLKSRLLVSRKVHSSNKLTGIGT